MPGIKCTLVAKTVDTVAAAVLAVDALGGYPVNIFIIRGDRTEHLLDRCYESHLQKSIADAGDGWIAVLSRVALSSNPKIAARSDRLRHSEA